jgi:DNA-directed RNA polymerase specialized sigma24 family protein
VKKEWVLSQEAFDKFLAWLDADRDRAGEKYEEIRRKLIKIFAHRGCAIAEELTDEAINRVNRRVQEIADTYVGDPALYFYGVAQKVYLEYVKKKPAPKPLPPSDPPDETERNYECLERCMQHLDLASREIILEYYHQERRAKIDHRKDLADRLGIALNTLRMRVHRIKAGLQLCVGDCLKQNEAT